MPSKLDPTAPLEWREAYHQADERRRRAGWRHADEMRSPRSSRRRRRIDAGRVLAVVMGVAALAVVLSLVVPV
jgi:hypothetical protein